MAKKIRKRDKTQPAKKPVLYFVLAGFIILFLPVFYLPEALDHAMMPRLFALGLFLLVFVPFVFRKKIKQFDFSILRDKLFFVMVGYFIVTVASIFFATNYKEGYFDIFKTFTIVSLTAVIAIIFSNTKDWDKKLPKFIIVAAYIAFTVGFIQYIDKVLMATSAFLPDGREIIYEVKGIMAHKNQYAISLMLMLPFLGFGAYQYKKGWRWASIVAFILLMVMIVLLQTRSAWAGILLSAMAVVFLISLFPKRFGISVKTRNIVATATIVVLVAGGTFIDIAGKKDPWSFVGKLRSIANPEAGNNVFRLKIWGLTTKMIADHPLTGVGAGNWKIHSADYYNQYDYNFEKDQLNWLRPHNDYLWVFAEKGIIGFLLYLSVFGFAIVYILKFLFSDVRPEQKTLALFLLSGLICYLTVSFFTFPLERINQQTYLALILASVVTLYRSTIENKKPINNKKFILYPALIILAMTVVYGYAMLDLEFKVRKTRNAMMQSNWKVMLREARTLSTTFRTLDTEATPIKSYEAQAYSNLGQTKKSRDSYIEALKAHPTKINMMNNLGKVYYELGDYEKAKGLFINALKILPEYQESLINLSTTYYKMGEYQKTLETLKRIPPDKRDETIKRNLKAIKRVLEEEGK